MWARPSLALCGLLLLALLAPGMRVWADEPLSAAPAGGAEHHRRRIAVVNFDVPHKVLAGWYPRGIIPVAEASNLSGVLSDMLTAALVKSGAFEVIERTQLQKVLDEHQLDAQGILDPRTAPQAGKILGVDLLVGGKLTEFGVATKSGGLLGALTAPLIGVAVDLRKSTARAVVDARVIDTTTGRILTSPTGKGENSETGLALAGTNFHNFFGGVRYNSTEWTQSRIGRATRDAVDDIVQQLLVTFPVEGVVKGVLPDGGIILDLGRFAGIKVGDEFQIMQETIYRDDKTGEEIYRDHKALGTLRVLEAQDDRCKCMPVGPLADTPKRGDYAVLVKKPAKK